MRLLGFEVTRRKRMPARFLGDVVRVELKAGDVCLLMSSQRLTAEQAESISAAWRATVGDDVTLLVLDEGLKIAVLSPPQAAAVQERLLAERAIEVALTE